MIKFPGSPPQMGPLCLPDGWPTGFFLPSALPTEAVGVCGGGLPGEHKGPCPATTSLCPPSFPREPEPFQPSLGRAQLGLAAVAGGGPVSPSPELCLWACLPGTDARWVPAGPDRGLFAGIRILGSHSSRTWGRRRPSHPPPIQQPDISRLRQGKT